MKIEITTSVENVEMANFLLGQAYQDALKNKDWQKHFKVTPKQLQKAETFRKALLRGFLKERNEERAKVPRP